MAAAVVGGGVKGCLAASPGRSRPPGGSDGLAYVLAVVSGRGPENRLEGARGRNDGGREETLIPSAARRTLCRERSDNRRMPARSADTYERKRSEYPELPASAAQRPNPAQGAGVSLPAMVWVLNESEAELGPRLVLLVLAEHAHDDGSNAFPSVETMCRRSRLSRRSVQGALRKLEADGHIAATGRRDSGTIVYRILGLDGGAISARGGVDSDVGGAKIATRGGAISALDPSGPNYRTQLLERVPNTIDRKPVKPEHASLAADVLAEWNQQTGQNLTSADWLTKFVMRIREYPDLTADDHAHVIAASLAAPWWKGAPTPSVVYGSGAQFERSILTAKAGPGADRVRTGPGGGPTADEMIDRARRLQEQGR